jgi:pimeloyl-ACP methyl ester carboxylesterase
MSLFEIITASTWLEYAELANDVYDPEHDDFSGNGGEGKPPKGWVRCKDATWRAGFDQGCRARLYQRISDQMTVLVYRGSKFNQYDSHWWALPNMLPFFEFSYEFYQKTLQYIADNGLGPLIAVIGHSMGGALAECIAIQAYENTHDTVASLGKKNPFKQKEGPIQDAYKKTRDFRLGGIVAAESQALQNAYNIKAFEAVEAHLKKSTVGKKASLYAIVFNPRHVGGMEVRYENGITVPFPQLKRDYLLSFEMPEDPVSSWLSRSPGAQRTNFRSELGLLREQVSGREMLYRKAAGTPFQEAFGLDSQLHAQQKTTLGNLEKQFSRGGVGGLKQHSMNAIITHLQVTDKSSHLGIRIKA